MPSILIIFGNIIDAVFGFTFPISQGPAHVICIFCFLIGTPWLAWSIIWQHQKGKGTPLPLVPTKDLLTEGPYFYMRNPMALGAILWLAGWTILFGTITGLIAGVGFFTLSVLLWDHFVEEEELLKKHGEKYRVYREKTPFLWPRIRF